MTVIWVSDLILQCMQFSEWYLFIVPIKLISNGIIFIGTCMHWSIKTLTQITVMSQPLTVQMLELSLCLDSCFVRSILYTYLSGLWIHQCSGHLVFGARCISFHHQDWWTEEVMLSWTWLFLIDTLGRERYFDELLLLENDFSASLTTNDLLSAFEQYVRS